MPLVTLDLPTPAVMRGRWAAFASVCAARGLSDGCWARDGLWHYDDGGGNWADLHLLDRRRAVLVGHDHEYSETYFAEAAAYFGEEETDLLAGAPDWWAPPARKAAADGLWVGFVYGFDGVRWQRAAYEPDDGFGSLAIPAASDERCRELVEEFAEDEVDAAAVETLMAADAEITPAMLRDVRTGDGWDPIAGAAAALGFRTDALRMRP